MEWPLFFLLARQPRSFAARELAGKLVAWTRTTLSQQTVSQRLPEFNFYARQLVVWGPVDIVFRRALLNWGRNYLHWTPRQWGSVLFTDESRFGLRSDFRRMLVWRIPGTRYQTNNMSERHNYGGDSFSRDCSLRPKSISKSSLATGALTVVPIVMTSLTNMFANFLLPFSWTDTNAQVHSYRVIEQYLQSVNCFEWNDHRDSLTRTP